MKKRSKEAVGAGQPSRADVERLFVALSEVFGAPPPTERLKCNSALADELRTRLEQLRVRYLAALELNDECLAKLIPKAPWFDPTREALVQEIDGKIVELVKLERRDPNIPLQVFSLLNASTFVPGSSSEKELAERRTSEAEIRLGAAVEDFYYASSRFWDLVEKDYLGKGKSRFIGVKMVRNRLLEHAEKGAINSFGATDTQGPLVKPLRNALGTEKRLDRGLIRNTFELLEHCKEAFIG